MNNEGNQKTILIVDDEPDVVFVLKMALEKNGYKTVEASNGLEALEKVHIQHPDAIILDLMMPKLDGHSVNLKLKEDPRTAHIPVIVVTGKGHLKELLDIREDLKVTAYLEKPFPVSLLLEKLGEIFKST
ncbi:MAG: response regulator [Elusimicrobia bacterium]|nr:response regulator [Candidatus Obscuribacterium magneticum]